MSNSWYYVKELAKNLNTELQGVLLHTPFTYKKNEIYLPFSGHPQFQCLHMVIKPPVPYLMTEDNIPKKKQVVKVLEKLHGCRLDKVKFHQADRQVLFEINGGHYYVLAQVYGINGNLFLLDQDFAVVEAFKSKKNYTLPDFADFIEKDPEISHLDLSEYFIANTDKVLIKFLKTLPFKFYSENLRHEICCRAALDRHQLVYNLTDEERDRLGKIITEVRHKLKAPDYYFYNGEMPVMAFLKLQHLNREGKKYQDFFEMHQTFISHSFRNFSFVNRKKILMTQIRKYFEIVEKRLTKSRQALDNLPDSNEYRKFGDAILANIQKITRGQKSVILPSFTVGEKELMIDLDPKIPPAKNADNFFKKAYKTDKAREELAEQIARQSEEKIKIQALVEKLEAAVNLDEIREIEDQLPVEITQQALRDEVSIRVPYKKFFYKKWEILVGKSAKDNDELTFKIASKFDFWLHASKVSGSHVIVRNPEKKEGLPEFILNYAAGIAAFFSKLKHSKVVPVNITQKK
jgi:predicted ribosome quality control (RQC) complex YloA/Tae2 family protein